MCGEARGVRRGRGSSGDRMNIPSQWLALALSCFALNGCVRVHSDAPFGGSAGGGDAGRGGSGRGGTGGVAGINPTAGRGGTSVVPSRGGSGAVGGRGGRGGTGGTSGSAGSAGSDDPIDAVCERQAQGTAGLTQLGNQCFACLCDMKPTETISCNRSCWRLLDCVIGSGCNTSDTTCIQSACVAPVGGMAAYLAAAQLAVDVPILGCRAQCFAPPDDMDAGP
jgi:hypothetical protein